MLMFNRYFKVACLVIVLLFLSLCASTLIRAHSYHEIAGQFSTSLVWRHEPVFIDVPNAAIIEIKQLSTGKGVLGLENTLKVQVTQPDGKMLEFPLQRSRETGTLLDGSYITPDFTPPLDGNYRFTLVGTIDELAVNDDIGIELCVDPGTLYKPQSSTNNSNSWINVVVVGIGIALVLAVGFFVWTRTKNQARPEESDETLS